MFINKTANFFAAVNLKLDGSLSGEPRRLGVTSFLRFSMRRNEILIVDFIRKAWMDNSRAG